MDTIKTALSMLSPPLTWITGQIAARPKGVLIAWTVSLVVVAWAF